jgi:hypothetical protein
MVQSEQEQKRKKKTLGQVYAVQAVWNKLGLSKALERAGISNKFHTVIHCCPNRPLRSPFILRLYNANPTI